MWALCAWGSCPTPRPAAGAQEALRKAWTHRGPLALWHPCPPHSLIELGGSAQWLPDVGRQVPGVLRGGPRQLLALGVVHVADVVQRPRLPDLGVAPRLGDPLQTWPPRSSLALVPAAPEARTQRGELAGDGRSPRTPRVTDSAGEVRPRLARAPSRLCCPGGEEGAPSRAWPPLSCDLGRVILSRGEVTEQDSQVSAQAWAHSCSIPGCHATRCPSGAQRGAVGKRKG